MAVPFHISTLKTASKSDEGEFVMLRFNFVTPGQAGNKKEDLVSPSHENRGMKTLIFFPLFFLFLDSRLMMPMPHLSGP
jgi:nucleosome binding factor SPN SPT16 subunit